MTITGYDLYTLPFAFVGGGYTTSYGTRSHLNNLLLVLHTDSGLVGLGEICRMAGDSAEPTGASTLQQYRARLPAIVGLDPLQPQSVRAALGRLENDLNNLACALETACFDLLGKVQEQPLWEALGGKRQDSIPVYHTIGQAAPQAMASAAHAAQEKGCRVIQAKLGGGDGAGFDMACVESLVASLREDSVLLADANGGWNVDTAAAVIGAFSDPRIYWEEPCKSYDENRRVAESSNATIILDQCVTGPDVARLACEDGVVSGMGIKCTMQGGLLAGRRSRDLAIEHGMLLKVDDSWSADVATTASLHLAMAVPPEQLIASVDMRPYFDQRISSVGPICDAYRFSPGSLPGLGLVADLDGLEQALR